MDEELEDTPAGCVHHGDDDAGRLGDGDGATFRLGTLHRLVARPDYLGVVVSYPLRLGACACSGGGACSACACASRGEGREGR